MGRFQKWEVKPVGVNDGLGMGNEEEGDVRVSSLKEYLVL